MKYRVKMKPWACVLLVFIIDGPAWLRILAVADGGKELQRAKEKFLKQYEKQGYGYGGRIDAIWETEIASRLPPGEHYIDYTGSSLYWNSQVEAAVQELEAAVYGNPHSTSPSSLRAEGLVEQLRLQVLRFLGADPEQYEVVWTRSGTGALHILGETFPWSPASRFAYLRVNHNSVLGIREYARRAGAAFGAVEEEELEAWLGQEPLAGADGRADSSSGSYAGMGSGSGTGGGSGNGGAGSKVEVPSILRGPFGHDEHTQEQMKGVAGWTAAEAAVQDEKGSKADRRQLRSVPFAQAVLSADHFHTAGSSVDGRLGGGGGSDGGAAPTGEQEQDPTYHLAALPALDNYAGVMYPLSWVKRVQAKSTAKERWKVLLDAAAFLPSHPLNLTATPADYVVISFYKLWGFPTGVGAWVVRRDDASAARKLYWGGGSVFLATSRLDWRQLRAEGPQRWEDGTLPFLDIIALRQGFRMYESLGGTAAIERHTSALREWLYLQLSALRHSSGTPLLRIFGRHHWNNSREVQGATFNFLLLKPDGQVFSYRKASLALAEAGFHIRCGCTCNPGSCYGSLGVADEEVQEAARLAHGNWSNWEWVWVQRPEVPEADSASGSTGRPLSPGSSSSSSLQDSPQEPDIDGSEFKVATPVTSTHLAGGDSHGSSAGSGPASNKLKWVKLPLGSLRASFGFMSRFEDAYALLDFLRSHYTDRTTDLEPSEVAAAGAGPAGADSSAAGTGASSAEGRKQREARRQERLKLAQLQGPGWC